MNLFINSSIDILENEIKKPNISMLNVLNTQESYIITIDSFPFSNIDTNLINSIKNKNTLQNFLLIEAVSMDDCIDKSQLNKSKKYFEKYSLEELKNLFQNFNWFELDEFKNSFLQELKNDRYSCILIKNMLLINMKISNIFRKFYEIQLILKPYESPNIENYNKNKVEIKKIKKGKNLKKNRNYNFIGIKRKKIVNDNSKINQSPKKISEFDNNKTCFEKINEEIMEILEVKKNKKMNYLTKSENINKNVKDEFNINGLNQSLIINNKEEELLISNMISCVNSKIKSYKLIFRATIDGDSARDFHLKCDNCNNLIILVKTTQGIRFGGYTSMKFGGSSHLKFDNDAFLFSLENQKVFRINSNQYAIYCYPNSGPCFSYGSLYIPNNFFKNLGRVGTIESPYNFSYDFELNNGKEYFYVKELEVFQVKIENIC